MAGLVLKGYEVKAIREGNVSFEGAYIVVRGKTAWLVNLTISKYSKQSQDVPEAEQRRDRQLILHEQEINKLRQEVSQKGKTAIPLALLLQHNLVKLELAIVKGRKEYEKKEVTKKRQIERDLQRERKGMYGL